MTDDTPIQEGPAQALLRETLEPQAPAPQLTPPEKDAWTYSKTLKLVRHILAHRKILPQFVRVWHRNGKDVQIGMSKGKGRIVLGAGDSFQAAFENLFLRPMKSKLEGEGAEPAR